MPLPANTTTVVVRGTYSTPEGNPSTGTVTFTPSAWLTNSGANIAIPNSAVSKTLGTAGDFSVTLPITDDSDLSPTGWNYTVSEVIDGVSQSYNVLIPGTVATAGTIYLADLAPAAAAGPEYYSLASSLSIGTVTTVATGGSATASITGLAPNQVLSLGIPVGATGNVASSGSGSVSAAAVYPTGDTDTGIYYPAANQVAITTGGTQALLLSGGAVSNPTFTGVASFPDGSASAPSITNTGDENTGILFPAADQVQIATGGSARATFSNSGLSVPEEFNLTSTGSFAPNLVVSNSGTGAGYFLFRRSASGGLVSNGDALGQIYWQGNDGSANRTAAAIDAAVDAAPGASDMPGRLRFLTTPDGSTTLTERMRIDNNGLITGTGTSLGAWTSYTPTLGGAGWAIGNGVLTGRYCQIGKTIHFRADITFGSTSTFGAGGLRIDVPVASQTTKNLSNTATAMARDVSAGNFYTLGVRPFSATTSSISLTVNGTNGLQDIVTSATPFTWADTDYICISGTYEIA